MPRRLAAARAPSTSSPRAKGLDADLELVEGLHHDEAFERYRAADIVVDQLNAGWYGVFAIEAMALGKPVVTYLHEEALAADRGGLPNTSADRLRLSRHASRDAPPPRRRRGPPPRARSRSRAYVERVHDLERVADRLLDLYARL